MIIFGVFYKSMDPFDLVQLCYGGAWAGVWATFNLRGSLRLEASRKKQRNQSSGLTWPDHLRFPLLSVCSVQESRNHRCS